MVPQQSRNSRVALVPQPSTSMATILLDLRHRPSAQVSPVALTAILRAQQVLSAITALHAQVHVAVLVNATASLAEEIESSSTVEVHAVATATIPVLVVLPAPIERKSTYLEAHDGTAS